MKQVVIKQGKIVVEEVPAPDAEPGMVLVEVHHSCISAGTEMTGIKASGVPLWKRALKQPEKARKALELLATQGYAQTKALVDSKVSAGQPTGYSAAGVVLAVGEGVDDLRPGDRVACGGAQCAHHAEVILVPRNLAVPIPEGLGTAPASTATVGAIALQGVRRASPTLGESFVVIGLGVIGQLTVQLLKANGCRVIGIDLARSRIALAKSLGLDVGVHPEDGSDVEAVMRLTDGLGADGVIITASTPSDAVMSTAFQMCRKKGRVVLVGDVGLHLNRWDFYFKEIDFFISTSYGPGRYDNVYEEKGLDYPVAYVRWTENRNMGEFLRLVAEGRVDLGPLIGATYPVDEAAAAYEALKAGVDKPPILLLSYPRAGKGVHAERVLPNPVAAPSREGAVRVAVVGAGSFAKTVHLPNVLQLPSEFHLRAIMSRTGVNANATARQFRAGYATTDYAHVLKDPEVDAVVIATRHDLHARLALDALRAGKHVLVEKPLALSRRDLEEFAAFYASPTRPDPKPVLLTGFNRRFSPFARRIAELTRERTNPMIINYRMNAGHVALDNWQHAPEGGGRNLGEACHIYDLFTFLTGSRVKSVEARAIRPRTGYYTHLDNFVATVGFEDGSVATLTYTALGSRDHPKEQMDLFVDGKVFTLNDYRSLKIAGARAKGVESRLVDKGHKAELEAFARAIREGGEWPSPLWQQLQAMEIAFRVEEQVRGPP